MRQKFFYILTLFFFTNKLILAQKLNVYNVNITSIDKFLENSSYKSTKNNIIPLIQVKNDKNIKYKIYIQGCLHANEITACQFVLWLANKTSKGQSLLNLISNTQFDFVPTANIDSVILRQRYNPNQINLNRNFSMFWGISSEPIGDYPFSEKETSAIKALMQNQKYNIGIDVHGFTNLIVTPSINPNIKDTDPIKQKYFNWIKILNTNMKNFLWKDYKTISALELGDGGAFEDWAFWENNTLAFCLEIKYKMRYIKKEDTFLRYEKFIYNLILDVITNKNNLVAMK